MSKRGTGRGAASPAKGAADSAKTTKGTGRRPTGSARKAAARRRRERRRRMTIAGLAVMVAGAVIAGVLLSRGSSSGTGSGAGAATVGYDRVTTFPVSSRAHTTSPVSYPQNPPVGGAHNPVWQNCGHYNQPVRNENAVHSLEHGAVWITYQPNLPRDQVERLASLARAQTYVLVSPYPGLPAPVVASAWGLQEWFHTATDPKLGDFVAKYRQGPQTPEPGAPCTGGTGTPQ